MTLSAAGTRSATASSLLPDKPGLGLELDESVCAAHPYRKNTFPSLWDAQWLSEFTQKDRSAKS